MTPPDPWSDALLAARLFAVAPHALGGVMLRAGAGPVRDTWLAYLRALLPADMAVRRVPLAIADERLLGGLDLAATLAADRPVARRGVLAETDGGIAILAMAERIDMGVAARIAAVLDAGAVTVERDGIAQVWPARIGIIACDEAQGDEDRPAAALAERLAFSVALDGIGARDAAPESAASLAAIAAEIAAARGRSISVDSAAIETAVGTAAAFGIDSARAPLMTLAAARAHAALAGRDAVEHDDLVAAARLVLVPRATRMPAPPDEDAPDNEPPPPPPENDAPPDDAETPETEPDIAELTDLLIAATLAQLPEGVLDAMAKGGVSRAPSRGSGQGQRRKSKLRGRPAGVRAGPPGAGARLNLIETLRAASAWQKLRRRELGDEPGIEMPGRVLVRSEDFRIQRFIERAESTTIFVVDASGSAALARLAETKGAVELLLAEAYVRRTQVALIVFRGAGPELLLPPTRSLARAKRCLTDMVGGGGTPLAAAIGAAQELALAAKSKGRTPFVVLLTDGRGNIARDGTPGRPQAEADALTAARAFGLDGIAAVFIDTSPRPRPDGAAIAGAMRARYAPLPQVEAGRVRDVVNAFDPAGAR